MGFFSKIKRKFIPKEISKPFDKVLDIGTDTFKKAGNVVRKITPKEIRPVLPFLSAAVPFMLPTTGIFASALNRGLISSLTNALSQEALDPEGDINLLSTALAGITGAGTAPGASEGIRGLKFTGDNPITKEGILTQLKDAPIGADSILDASNVGIGKRIANLGLEGAAQVTDFLGGSKDTFSKIGERPELAFTREGAKELGQAIALPTAQGMGDNAYTTATRALRDFEETQLIELEQAGATEDAIANARRSAIREAMEAAQFTEEDIIATFDEIGLKEGGIVSLAEGGMLNFGGREMDLRGGGFVPIGKKEKADDVPARLSKNEFVMTADAVRAAGGGSVNKGAQRMYDLMNQLEARA